MAIERLPPLSGGPDTGVAKPGQFLAGVKRVIDWLLTRHDVETRRIASSTLAGTTAAIALGGTTVNVEHGHGRAWVGWRIVDRDAAAPIFRDAASTAASDKHLSLKAGDPVVTGSASTTDATVTTAATYTPADGTVVTVVAVVSARLSTGASAAGYVRTATFRRAGATTSIVGAVGTPHTAEDVAGWDCTIDASGTDVRVRVTGAAASTISWVVTATITIGPAGSTTVNAIAEVW